MKTRLWILVVVAMWFVGFLAGYSVSARTGVEAGYFETAEAGGYGVSDDAGDAAEIDKEAQEYYKRLTED